jgi:hypothetical protein
MATSQESSRTTIAVLMANRIPSKFWKTIVLFQVDQVCTSVHDTYTNNVCVYIMYIYIYIYISIYHSISIPHAFHVLHIWVLSITQGKTAWHLLPLRKIGPKKIRHQASVGPIQHIRARKLLQQLGSKNEDFRNRGWSRSSKQCKGSAGISNEQAMRISTVRMRATLKAINETVCIAINRGVWPTPTVQGLQRSRYSVLPISRHLLNPHSMSMRHPMDSRYNLHCWGNFKNRDTVLH